MPRTKKGKVERMAIRIPKSVVDEIDRMVVENDEFGWNRQQFIEHAIREQLIRVKSTILSEKK